MANQSSLALTEAKPSQVATAPAFSFALSPNELVQLMNTYGLKASDVVGLYQVSSALFHPLRSLPPFNTMDAAEANHEKSIDVIRQWPKQLNWVQFNTMINRLLQKWLEDYQAGAALANAFVLARSLTLQTAEAIGTQDLQHADQTVSLKFQSFLMHLLATATHQFDAFQFNYIQHYDLETGLPNQRFLLDILNRYSPVTEAAVAQANDVLASEKIGILVIQLNINFDKTPQLNAISNQIVRAAVDVVEQHLSSDATLFRIGVFEFAIIVENLHFSAQLNLMAAKLAHAFETELPLENVTLILKPIFGGICSLEEPISALSLFDNAKLALHHALVNDSRIEIYDKVISNMHQKAHQLEEAIITALQHNELEMYFQPIVTLPNAENPVERCVSAELLLRWISEEWPSVSPFRLIETIYKKGFGKVFIRWLINSACRHCAELLSNHQRNVLLTINLCTTDLLDEDLPELLSQSIALWEIPAENLVMEITETDILANEEKVSQVLDQIVSLGCRLALDDFGTGYSSMARLRNMPVDLVKIDQSFVRNIATSNQDKEIVVSILKLAHSLGKEVVAEGVEDPACLQLLRMMKCDKIQGYYYSKPLPFEAFATWLAAFEATHST
ncbi:MAG TPA: GGDEF domain-containing protein [Methylotenera sp.]|nr:GGDEF domain-containing protein [Methylotenera sp.]HPV32235.1 GGDEF domain-containing protein [Methylotenera sp.]